MDGVQGTAQILGLTYRYGGTKEHLLQLKDVNREPKAMDPHYGSSNITTLDV